MGMDAGEIKKGREEDQDGEGRAPTQVRCHTALLLPPMLARSHPSLLVSMEDKAQCALPTTIAFRLVPKR